MGTRGNIPKYTEICPLPRGARAVECSPKTFFSIRLSSAGNSPETETSSRTDPASPTDTRKRIQDHRRARRRWNVTGLRRQGSRARPRRRSKSLTTGSTSACLPRMEVSTLPKSLSTGATLRPHGCLFSCYVPMLKAEMLPIRNRIQRQREAPLRFPSPQRPDPEHHHMT